MRQAADALRSEHGEPSLLIGHSAAGPAVLSAAAALPEVRAVVTVGSPAPRRRRLSTVPLLVLHAPDDHVVPAREANRVFAAALHPRSFIALDGADHDVSEPHHARRVAGLVAAWAEPYLPEHAASPPPLDPSVSLVVTDAGTYMSFSSEVFPGGGECANESTRNFLKSYMAEFRDHVVRVLTVLPRQQ